MTYSEAEAKIAELRQRLENIKGQIGSQAQPDLGMSVDPQAVVSAQIQQRGAMMQPAHEPQIPQQFPMASANPNMPPGWQQQPGVDFQPGTMIAEGIQEAFPVEQPQSTALGTYDKPVPGIGMGPTTYKVVSGLGRVAGGMIAWHADLVTDPVKAVKDFAGFLHESGKEWNDVRKAIQGDPVVALRLINALAATPVDELALLAGIPLVAFGVGKGVKGKLGKAKAKAGLEKLIEEPGDKTLPLAEQVAPGMEARMTEIAKAKKIQKIEEAPDALQQKAQAKTEGEVVYDRALERARRQDLAESEGQAILDGLESADVNVNNLHQTFWKDVHPKLPEHTQARFQEWVQSRTGEGLRSGESWSDVALRFIELPDDVGRLTGGERGYVSMMAEAMRRVERGEFAEVPATTKALPKVKEAQAPKAQEVAPKPVEKPKAEKPKPEEGKGPLTEEDKKFIAFYSLIKSAPNAAEVYARFGTSKAEMQAKIAGLSARQKQFPEGKPAEPAPTPEPVKVTPAKVLPKEGKQPWEMTREEFEADFFFHGKGTFHPTFGKRGITGGVTKNIPEASMYAERGKGEIHLIRKRNLAPGARQEMADVLREQRALGNKKAKADRAESQGFQSEGRIQSEIVIPGSVKHPHEYLIKQAIREGKPVPAEVLAEYPELAKPKVEKGAVEPDVIGERVPVLAEEVSALEAAKTAPMRAKEAEMAQKQAGSPAERVVETKAAAMTERQRAPIGLNKSEIKRMRENTGIDQLEPAERITWLETAARAKKEKVKDHILETADEILKSERPTTAVEHTAMVDKIIDLSNDYEAAIKTVGELAEKGDVAAVKLENARASSIMEQMDKITEASDMGGREAARAMAIRRMRKDRETYDIAHVVQRAQAAKGSKLTTAERGKYEKLAENEVRYKKRVDELLADNDRLVLERDKAAAEKVTGIETRKAKIESRKKVRREKIQTERTDIKKQLTAMGFRVNDVTGVTAEGSYLVGKLAVNYIKDGAVSLDAVVQKVLADLPQLTKRDVYQSLITKDPRVQHKARMETLRRIKALKQQAKLILDVEKAEKGVFDPRTPRQSAPAYIKILQRRLRDLRAQAYKTGLEPARLEKAVKTINELQDQLANQYRSVKKGKPELTPDLAVAREKIKDLRKTMHVADELTKTQDQLRTGNFDIKVKSVEKPILPELERAQIQLKVNRKQIRQAIKEGEPMTVGKVGVEAINTARTLKATADMSAVMRQGLVLSVRRPIKAGQAFGKSFKAFFSKYTAEQIDLAIKSAPHHYIREKSGLQLMEVGGRVSRGEEMFMSNVAEKIPLYGRVIKASERHMVSYLNMIRTAAFDQFLQKYPNATHAELKAWANYVNVASGRGNLGKFAGAANALSLGFFAPKFAISRIQTPLALFGKSSKGVTRRVRKEIAKDLVATASLGATALTLAHFAGAEVGTDPRSADWGKIKVGNTRIDIWGGMQQPMRVVARIGLGITDKAGLTGKDLTDWQKDVDPLELVARFSQYKMAPTGTIPLELYKGKTIVGEDVTPTETAAKAAIPMVYEDMRDAWRLEGAGQAAWVGVLAFFGVGASTYSRKEGRENTIRKLLEEARRAKTTDARKKKEKAAKTLQTKWNNEHEKDQISIL